MQIPGPVSYKCRPPGLRESGPGLCLRHKHSTRSNEGPLKTMLSEALSWISLGQSMKSETWVGRGWVLGITGIFPSRTTSVSAVQSSSTLPHILLLCLSWENLVFRGQIEMPECMEINHRIIQTAAYHLPYIWHNYPTSNMKMLYCNNSQAEEKAVLLITWK